MLIRRVRPVRIGTAAWTVALTQPDHAPIDIRVEAGRVTAAGAGLASRGELTIEGGGRWVIPGLWDAHVHFGQWALSRGRLDLSGTHSPSEVTTRVRDHLREVPAADEMVTFGQGFRSAPWSSQPTVAELDAVSGSRPVVLISGDAHNGWLNTAALRLLALPDRDVPLEENEWFAVLPRLQSMIDSPDTLVRAYRRTVAEAAARGVVGVTDFEFGPNFIDWPQRLGGGIEALRVRAACYPDRLEQVIRSGLRTGDQLLPGSDLITMGPLKIISDGSLNTRTAYCCEAYGGVDPLPSPHGVQNSSPEELQRLLQRAHDHGLRCAVHAIGDAAAADALDAFAATGAGGSIEHAQLMRRSDIARMAALSLQASVQPAHLLDDRDVTEQYWADRADRCFPFRSLLDAGVTLALGSDAPVSPLDPWLAMAAAVHRSADERDPWNPAEAITATEALAASVDGVGTVGVGSRADLVLLDHDPLAPAPDSAAVASRLRSIGVACTIMNGQVTHTSL